MEEKGGRGRGSKRAFLAHDGKTSFVDNEITA
jgi:hypothetical protein